MRSFFVFLFIGLLSFGLVVNEAAAKRFGGGRSFGVQRSYSSLYSAKPKQTMMGKSVNKSPWKGVLGGLLAGGLLASLFMGNGLASGLLSWLVVGVLLLVVVNLFRRRMQPGWQASMAHRAEKSPYTWQNQPYTSSQAPKSQGTTGFMAEEFLRDAKVKFIRLQAAYDQKNLEDLSAFTAPEVFAEIKMQLDERGNEPNKTEVINLNAELLDVAEQADATVASVRFTGSIKENNDPITALDEIWHFRQFYGTQTWVIGGIQQEVFQPQ